jgi:hypothetical protein
MAETGQRYPLPQGGAARMDQDFSEVYWAAFLHWAVTPALDTKAERKKVQLRSEPRLWRLPGVGQHVDE